MKTARIAMLILALCMLKAPDVPSQAGLQPAQPTTTPKYFWSNDRKIPLEVFTDILAVQGQRSVARTRFDEFRQGIRSYADDRLPNLAAFDREGFFFVSVAAGASEQARDGLVRSQRVQQVGLAAAAVRDGIPLQQAPVLVVTPEFIVRFKADVPQNVIDEFNRAQRAVPFRPDPFVDRQFIYTSQPPDPNRTLDLAAAYYERGICELAHPNFVIHRVSRAQAAPPPNDPLFGDQWHLDNTGQKGGWQRADVRALDAWGITKGSPNILIAIIDPDGIQLTHEDLTANRWFNPGEAGAKAFDGVDNDDGGPFPDDISGWNFLTNSNNPASNHPHGTAVAGVAVAEDGKGVSGIAPHCKLLGIMQGATVQDDADAFRYAAKKGADIISCSWGYDIGTPATQVVENAIHDVATKNGRGGKGCAIFFAMTNEKLDNFGGPGGVLDISSHADVIAIGRSTNLDTWGDSGFGRGMALLAPTNAATGTPMVGCDPHHLAGTLDVTTTDLMGGAGYNKGMPPPAPCPCNPGANENVNGNYTNCFGGTSSATPLAAGVGALVLSVNRNLTAEQVRTILIETADKIDPGRAHYQQPDFKGQNRLYSNTHGYGRVNAYQAVNRAKALAGGGHTLRGPASSSGVQVPVTTITFPSRELDDQSQPPAPEKAVMIANRPAEPMTILNRGTPRVSYALKDVLALELTPETTFEQVLPLLGERFGPLNYKERWAGGFTARNVLIVQGPSSLMKGTSGPLADLIKQKYVQSIGRVVFFDKHNQRSVAILPDRFYVQMMPGVTEEGLQRFSPEIQVLRPARFEPGRYLLGPQQIGIDPLKLLGILTACAEHHLIDPTQTRPDWITPIQMR